jgi:hypothetical protein
MGYETALRAEAYIKRSPCLVGDGVEKGVFYAPGHRRLAVPPGVAQRLELE